MCLHARRSPSECDESSNFCFCLSMTYYIAWVGGAALVEPEFAVAAGLVSGNPCSLWSKSADDACDPKQLPIGTREVSLILSSPSRDNFNEYFAEPVDRLVKE